MQVQHNIPLSQLTTMRLGGPASHVTTVTSTDELLETFATIKETEQPYFVLGGGSNVIARDEGFSGIIILNRILGFEQIDDDAHSTTFRIGAGENWDSVVARVCEIGLSGIEAMSAIPGTAGATPVQNVGAYGQEIADTLVELEAYDTILGEMVTLTNDQCHFSYRNSIFKDPLNRHHVITSITLKLRKDTMQPPFYTSLQNYLDQHNITDYSPTSIRQAVTSIRAIKLPDPTAVANTGSFFKNPIVTAEKAKTVVNSFPDVPQYPLPDGSVKLAAGWLIEKAGLRGYANHGMKTYEENALVVVNDKASSYSDLFNFREEIVGAVRDKFGITLEQEPETL